MDGGVGWLRGWWSGVELLSGVADWMVECSD